MVLGIIATILSAIGSIVGVVVDTGKAVLDTIMSFFQSVFSLLQSFIQSAPTAMKMLIFLFFLLSIGNVFSNFFLSTRYACNGNNILYETENIGSAMTLMLKTQFQALDMGERNTYIMDNFQLASQKASPTTIRCSSASPRLYFYSINVLDYKTWLLLLVLIMGAPVALGYYSMMGALH